MNRLVHPLLLLSLPLAMVLLPATASLASVPAPASPALAASNWPSFHRGPYSQASTPLAALDGGVGSVQTRPYERGGTSPWTVLGAVQPDGWQMAWASTLHGVVKRAFRGDELRDAGEIDLGRRPLHFDWNLMVLADGTVLTTSRVQNAYLIVGDRVPACMDCGLAVKRRIVVPKRVGTVLAHFQIGYDGTLFGLLEGNRMAAVDLRAGRVIDVIRVGFGDDDVSFHNAFPADESGRVFLASQAGVTALDWDGRRLRTAWTARYDFRGPGCPTGSRNPARETLRVARGLRCTGSGTTPTLLGTPRDGVMVTVDGHAPRNRLVAFWRGEIPEDWPGLPGYDRRVAGVLALPHSTPDGDGFTAENSPAAWGNAVFIAQWAGFRPACDAPRGVQRVDWEPGQRRLVLRWANPDVHFNGVPSVAAGNRRVLGVGLGPGCVFHYRALDLDSGRIVLDHPLGHDERYLDQGNQHTIGDDGSVLYAGVRGIVRLTPAGRP